ncbi:MAG: 6-carboxytetrahydropterin synthase [Pseudobdellovibrionaceae bacterium]
MIVTLQEVFSSAHFYAQAQWSEEKNRQVFGRCYTPYGHGHNYKLEASFQLDDFIEPVPGQNQLFAAKSSSSLDKTLTEKYQPQITALQTLLKTVVQKLDHEHLNFVIAEFKEKVPTTENIALYLADQVNKELRPKPQPRLTRIKLYEMEDLWVDLKIHN